MTRIVARALAFLVFVGPLAAHGGGWGPPPPPPPPPDPPQPGGAVGGLTPGGSSTNHPGSPGSRGPASPRAVNPSPPLAGPRAPGSGGRAVSTGAPMPPAGQAPTAAVSLLGSGFDLSVWTWWWELNKEPYLELKAHLYARPPVSGGDGFFLGRGARNDAARTDRRPTNAQIRAGVVPALLNALREESSNDVVTACLVALARIGDDSAGADRIEWQDHIKPFLTSSSQEIAETAAVSLGILGHESAALLLSELVLDTELGRRLVGQGRVPLRTRAFAAYGLGLVGIQSPIEDVRRYVVHKLSEAVAKDDSATPDLGVACVLTLGRIPLPWGEGVPDPEARRIAAASRQEQVQFLLELLDADVHRIVRAHVPVSLGTLLAADTERHTGPLRERVVDELLERFDPRKRETREMRQSIAIALGLIGENDADDVDLEIRRALIEVDDERQVRNLAQISLGRVGGRAGQGPPHEVEEISRALLERVGGRKGDLSRWAGLGLALFERERRAAGFDHSSQVSVALHDTLRRSNAPLDVGAYSIASGLLGDLEASPVLLTKLDGVSEESARGYAAIGLGLLEAREAVEAVRAIVDASTYRPRLLRESAIALGLLGDREAATFLTRKLAETKSLSAQASIAQALGRIGDRDTIVPLIEMLQDESITERARAFAAVALGLVADQDALPWNTWLSVDINYTAAPVTLYDEAGYGLLNIL